MKRLLTVVVALAAQAAWACSCANRLNAFPRTGSTAVPLNAIIQVVHRFVPDGERYRLVRAVDQREVESDVVPGARVTSIKPVAKLEAGTDYELWHSSSPVATVTFKTGHFEDDVAPAPPVVKDTRYTSSSETSCGVRRWTLSVEGGDDGETPREQLLLLALGEDPTEPRGVAPLGAPVLFEGACSTNFSPPRDGAFPLRFRVMDLAGNVSEISPEQMLPGCNSTPAGALVVLALALLVAPRPRSSK